MLSRILFRLPHDDLAFTSLDCWERLTLEVQGPLAVLVVSEHDIKEVSDRRSTPIRRRTESLNPGLIHSIFSRKMKKIYRLNTHLIQATCRHNYEV